MYVRERKTFCMEYRICPSHGASFVFDILYSVAVNFALVGFLQTMQSSVAYMKFDLHFLLHLYCNFGYLNHFSALLADKIFPLTFHFLLNSYTFSCGNLNACACSCGNLNAYACSYGNLNAYACSSWNLLACACS